MPGPSTRAYPGWWSGGYWVGQGEVYCLATTLTGHQEFPAIELAAAYQQRWEFENTLDELEIHQRGPGRILRSKSAEMVKQEIWALLRLALSGTFARPGFSRM